MHKLSKKKDFVGRKLKYRKQRFSMKVYHPMVYEIDYHAGEKAGCSSRLIIAERMFYVKLFQAEPARFFSGDQQGIIQKEISKSEFELWLNILADNEVEISEIQGKLGLGKKY